MVLSLVPLLSPQKRTRPRCEKNLFSKVPDFALCVVTLGTRWLSLKYVPNIFFLCPLSRALLIQTLVHQISLGGVDPVHLPTHAPLLNPPLSPLLEIARTPHSEPTWVVFKDCVLSQDQLKRETQLRSIVISICWTFYSSFPCWLISPVVHSYKFYFFCWLIFTVDYFFI